VSGVAVVLIASLSGCDRPVSPSRDPRRLGNLGNNIVVLAPHPDDEALGAAGVLEAAVHAHARTTVVIATDGEAGRDHSHVPHDLPAARDAESLRALARIGVPATSVHFLHYADGGLAAAWSDRWTTTRRDGTTASGRDVLDDLEAAIGDRAPSALVVPSVLDEHGDHRGLARFALLAVLAERQRWTGVRVLGYLIHGGRGWPGRPPPDSCVDDLFPWVALSLDGEGVREKTALIGEYATQAGPRLLGFARPLEPFVQGLVVRSGRPSDMFTPRVRRTANSVVVELRRTRCVFGDDPGGRLRVRFLTGADLEERLITLGREPDVAGGAPGGALHRAVDVRVASTPEVTRLVLAGDIPDQRGALLEILPRAMAPAPAWLLLW
jgi:LmbE family N-acetylglucosaminyl deacetylase